MEIIKLKSFHDERGSLTVIDRVLPFDIKRVFYIYDVKERRGGHGHKKSHVALVCVKGQCEVFVDDGHKRETVILDSPDKVLALRPEEWHTMDKFSSDSLLLVLASEHYDPNDYFTEQPS